MATEQQIMEGIRRADAAGDSQSVQALGRELQRVRQQPGAARPSDSAAGGFVAGALKPIDNLTKWASGIPGFDALDRAGQSMGLPSAQEGIAQNDAYRASNTRTGYQALGNIAGTLPTAYLPGGLLAQGAAGGALLSDQDSLEGVAEDAGIGALTSKAAGSALKFAGDVVAPRVSDAGKALYNAGVPQTLGQILSDGKGFLSRTISNGEEALTSMPLLGDAINMAREGGVNAYNMALGNRALGNIGQAVPDNLQPGDDFVPGLYNIASDAYENLVPKLKGLFDQPFVDDLSRAKSNASTLPDVKQAQFERIMRDVFENRASGDRITGKNLKEAESRMTEFIRKYGKETAPGDDQVLAESVSIARQGLRDSIGRSNPAHQAELAALNKTWAQLKPMDKASVFDPQGIIRPGRMNTATRTAGMKRDPLVRAANARLPNRTPDSGTTRRGLATIGTLGATGAAGGALLNPALAIPAALAALYTKHGMQGLNKIAYAERNKATKAVGEGLRYISDKAAPLASGIFGYLRSP